MFRAIEQVAQLVRIFFQVVQFVELIREMVPHEFPLHGMPYAERENLPDHIPSFDGELCTICEERLQEQYSGDWKRMPVVRRNYRLSAGFGLLRVEDSLPEAKEAGEVPESWLSVFKRANGGALFMDLSSEAQPRKFRSMIGNLVTDGTIRTQDQTEVHLDIAIVSISNTHLQEEAQLGALADRIIPVKFHLPLDVQSELKIHNPVKKQKVNNVHYIPGIREIFSRMIVVSRLEPSQSTALTLTSEDAILFYGGGAKLTDDKMSLVYHSYKELREKRPLDGAKGFTVREAGILRNKVEQYHSCIGIQHIFSMLRDPAYYRGKDTDIKSRIKDWIVLDPDKEGNYSLGKMEEWYRSYLKRDLVRAWLGFDRFGEMKERYFKDYLNHALHYTMKRKIFDPKTNEELPVDEDMLRLIENEMGVSKAIEDKFRSGVNAFFRNQGREVLADHMPLHDAIERVIMSFKANKDALSPFEEMQQAILEKTQDIQKAKKKLDFVMAELLAHGYQECCWENVRMYAKRFMFA